MYRILTVTAYLPGNKSKQRADLIRLWQEEIVVNQMN